MTKQNAIGLNIDMISRIITTDTTLTVASSGGDFTSLADALAYLNGYFISSSATVTISVAGEKFTLDEIDVIHPNGDRIKIVGATPLTPTVTSVQSSSGSAGAWSIVLNLSDVTGITTDMLCNIPYKKNDNTTNLSGGSNPSWLCGCWVITNVNTENNRITITSSHRGATAPSGNVAGQLYILKTVFTWAKTGTENMLEFKSTKLADLDNIGFLGAGSGNCVAVIVWGEGASVYMGKNVGYNGGWWAGAYVHSNGYMWCRNQCSSKNTNGFVSYVKGQMEAYYCTATGNTNGFECGQNSSIRPGLGLAGGNSAFGLRCIQASFALATSLVGEQNTTNDIFSSTYSYISAVSSSTSSISPSANTQGNEYGYIDT